MSMGPLGFGVGGGGGSVSAPLTLASGTITDDAPALTITQTWNNGSETFTAFKVNATDTASASGSLLMDLQVGGSSLFSVSKAGLVALLNTSTAGIVFNAGPNQSRIFQRFNQTIHFGFAATSATHLAFAAGGAYVRSSGMYRFSSSATDPYGTDVALARNAAGVAEINSGTASAYRDLRLRYLDVQGSDAAAAQTATLTNGPTAGNPSEWMPVKFNGNLRYVPVWA